MNGFLRTARAALLSAVACLSFTHAFAAEPAQDESVLTAEVSDTELSDSRGAFLPSTLNVANVEQSAQDRDNVVIGGMTGSNLIGAGSFTNTQGLVNVIQNSGNNVLIQSSTVVNMSFSK